MYKIRLQRYFFWNLQQMGKVTRPSCWHQNFVFKGLSDPAPGLYTCGKTLKTVYKIRIQRDCFWNLQQMVEVVRAFCWHQNFDPKGLSAIAPGLYTCIEILKNVYKIRIHRDPFETCNKWSKWSWLSLDVKSLSPRSCLLLAWGYIYAWKH